jgi:hypothetical protein
MDISNKTDKPDSADTPAIYVICAKSRGLVRKR